MIRELRHRDPLLFWSGALMLLMLLVVTLISIGDTRQILGLNPWIKPMKFLTSITIFLWTVAWFMPDTQPKPLARALVRWTIVIAMLTEIAIITMQAARGTISHFNAETVFDNIMFCDHGSWRGLQHRGDDAVLVDHPPRHADRSRRLPLGHPPRRA